MSAVTLVIAAAIVGLVLGSALVPGAPIFALPIVAVLVLVLGLTEMRRRSEERRSMQEFRERGETEPVDFTARDKRTLT
jgi:type III secretory pathway component EscV